MIYCFVGDDHHPPLGLQLGETIDIGGQVWALVATNGGHSRNSFVFRPHSGQPRPPLRRAKRKRQQLNATSLMQEALAAVDAALNVPEFLLSTPQELKEAWLLIDTAVAKTTALQEAMAGPAKQTPELRPYLQLLREAMREIEFQQKDAAHFRTHYIGEVTP